MKTFAGTIHRRLALGFLCTALAFSLHAIAPAQDTAADGSSNATTQQPLPDGVTISARVDPQRVVVGDAFRYTILIEGNATEQQFEPPVFPRGGSIEVISGPSTRNEFIFDGTRSVMRRSWTYSLRANTVGVLTIPPARLMIAGRWYDTNTIDLRIDDVPVASGGVGDVISGKSNNPEINRELQGNYFALAEFPETIYRGQAVPLTVYIYRAPQLVSFSRWERVRDASGSDFIIPQTQEPIDSRTLDWQSVRFGDRSMERVALYTTWVVPTKSGELRITPPHTRIYLTAQNRNTRRIEDMMFGPGLIPVELETRTKRVNVLEPPPRPEGAILQAVGDLTSRVTVDRTDRTTGKTEVPQREILTVNVTIAGEGFLDLIPAPTLPDLPGLLPIDRKTSTRARIEGGRFMSQKNFEYIFQASTPGEVEIPALSFAMYNPITKRQEIINSEAVRISILPAAGDAILLGGAAALTGIGSAPARAGTRVLGGDVAYIDASPLTGAAATYGGAFYVQPWFWLLQLIPVLTALGLGGWRLYSQMNLVETPEAKARRVRREVEAALAKARGMVNGGTRDEYYALVATCLMGYTATRLGVSPLGLTVEDAARRLLDSGADATAVTRLTALLERCNSIRFSPAPDTPEARAELVAEAGEILLSLEGGPSR